MNEYFISIIIPTYNSEKYISDTLNSVFLQSYKNFEVIIVDDYSSDGTLNIINEFLLTKNNIKLFRLKKNFGGPAKPRNIGIKNSNGNLIAFLDSDDLWDSRKLEKQVNFIKKNKLNFTSSNFKLIDENGNYIDKLFFKFLFNLLSKKKLENLIINNFIALSSTLIKNLS